MIYIPAHINSEKFERLRSSKYTPSVSLSLDSSLREGAGNGCGERVPFIGVLAKPWGCGRFSSPLRNSDFFTVYVHRGTLPQSRFARQLPQGGSRERLRGAGAIHRGTCETGRVRAIFIAPTKLRRFWISPFIGGRGGAEQNPLAGGFGGGSYCTLWQRMAQRVWPLVLQVKRVRSQSPWSMVSTSLGPTVSMEVTA